MHIPVPIITWLHACKDLFGYDDIPGYRRLHWLSRKKLDALALCRGVCKKGFWRAFSAVLFSDLLIHVSIWRHDLDGVSGDILRTLSPLLAMPWMAAARKRQLRALLKGSETGRN
jgi:hypothetical protein